MIRQEFPRVHGLRVTQNDDGTCSVSFEVPETPDAEPRVKPARRVYPVHYRTTEGLFAVYPFDVDPDIYRWAGSRWVVWDNAASLSLRRMLFQDREPTNPSALGTPMPPKDVTA